MSDETPEPTPTRRLEPGLTQRLSLGMGTLTLAGAAFFGVAAVPDVSADTTSSVSDSSDGRQGAWRA